MISGPCRNCKDRTIEPINCHMICEKYLEFRKICDEEHETRIEKKKIADYNYDRKIKLHK